MPEGRTYDPLQDEVRLTSELWLTARFLACGDWLTIPEIRARIQTFYGKQCSETGISARIRDLRKPEHGGHTVESRRRAGAGSGTWEFRLAPRGRLFPS